MDPILIELKACLKELAQLQKQAPNLSKVFNKEQLALIREVKTLIENEQLAKGELVSSKQQEIPTAENSLLVEEKASLENEETYSSAEKSITKIESDNDNGIKDTEEYKKAKTSWENFESTIEAFKTYLNKNSYTQYDAKKFSSKLNTIQTANAQNPLISEFVKQVTKILKNEVSILGHALLYFFETRYSINFDNIMSNLELIPTEEALKILNNCLTYPSLEELLSGLKTFNPSDLDEIINPTKPVVNSDKIESIRAAMLAEKSYTFSVTGTIVLPNGEESSYTFVIPVVLEFAEKEKDNAPFYKIKSEKVDYSDGSGGKDGVTLGESKITQNKDSDVYLDLMVIGKYTATEITNTIGNDANVGINNQFLSYSVGHNSSTSQTISNNYSISKRFRINVIHQRYSLEGKTIEVGKKPLNIKNEKGEFTVNTFLIGSPDVNEASYEVNGIKLKLTWTKFPLKVIYNKK